MNLPQTSHRFLLLPHVLVPIVLFIFGTICQYSGLDEWLIRPFYDANSQSWPYQSVWFIAGFLHKGGRDFIALIGGGLVLTLIGSFFYRPLSKYRRDLVYLVLGMASGILIVALLKNSTHIYSPSKLLQYGGELPHIRIFDSVAPDLPIGHAFPAGHASGAFALISFYFLLALYGSKWRYPALGFCLSLGFIFGLAQQARGKHFFSHDLFSLAICWGAALLVLYAMRLPKKLASRDT